MLLPTQPTTLLDELISAARGVAAILVGDRRAPSYFDFSPRGLAGSFIVLLAAAAIGAFQSATSSSTSGVGPSRLLLLSAVIYAVQVGIALLILRQLKRQDVFVPYLVASNWSSFYVSAADMLLRLVGVEGAPRVIFLGIAGIVIEINVARLVLTLTPRQIAAFLLVPIVVLLVVAFILASIFLPMDTATTGS